ncbi:MAG: transposase family protein [Sterolibacteriaceae bacterium]|nr:transposase family protein [Sterolibacteriaceae bacterium]
MTLMETFSGLPDQRKGAALRFSLAQILVMAICAVLCGADNWSRSGRLVQGSSAVAQGTIWFALGQGHTVA